MQIEDGFLKRSVKKVAQTIALSTALAGGMQASNLEIAQAQTAVSMAEFDVAHAKNPGAKIKAERMLALAKAKLEEAKAKDADEKASDAKNTKPAKGQDEDHLGVTHQDNSVKKPVEGSIIEVDIKDKNGNTIGKKKLIKGSAEWRRHMENMAKIDAKKARDVAKASRPVVVNDSRGNYYDNNGGRGGSGNSNGDYGSGTWGTWRR